jgi:hypothetical protein
MVRQEGTPPTAEYLAMREQLKADRARRAVGELTALSQEVDAP